MANEISAELKDKIQSITAIDTLLKQISKLNRELFEQSSVANETKLSLTRSQGDLNNYKQELEGILQNVKFYESEANDKSNELKTKQIQRDNMIKSSCELSAKLQSQKENAIQALKNTEETITKFSGEVLFLGLDKEFGNIFDELKKASIKLLLIKMI